MEADTLAIQLLEFTHYLRLEVKVVDGIEAIDAYLNSLNEESRYDLICLDIMMPRLDGIKALKSIREIEKHKGIEGDNKVKIIMLSGVPILVGDVDGIEEKVVTFITICNEIQSKNIDGYYIDLTFAKPYIKVKQ